MPGEPPKNPQILSCLNIHPANLFRLAYSRNKLWFRQYIISANTIGFREGEILQKIHNVLPICQGITYFLSKRKQK